MESQILVKVPSENLDQASDPKEISYSFASAIEMSFTSDFSSSDSEDNESGFDFSVSSDDLSFADNSIHLSPLLEVNGDISSSEPLGLSSVKLSFPSLMRHASKLKSSPLLIRKAVKSQDLPSSPESLPNSPLQQISNALKVRFKPSLFSRNDSSSTSSVNSDPELKSEKRNGEKKKSKPKWIVHKYVSAIRPLYSKVLQSNTAGESNLPEKPERRLSFTLSGRLKMAYSKKNKTSKKPCPLQQGLPHHYNSEKMQEAIKRAIEHCKQSHCREGKQSV